MAKTWQSKKIVALVTALFLVPMLSGCMNIKVDLKIDQAARATGSYYVEFDKETAANFEISSKEEMFAFLTEKNSELKKGDVKLSESEKNYIANISVKGTPLDDKDMKAQVLSNGDIKFHYFAEPSNNSEDDKETMELLGITPEMMGNYEVIIEMPGKIKSISGVAVKISDTKFKVSHLVSDGANVDVVSSVDKSLATKLIEVVKKPTVTCVKGKTTKKYSGNKCPAGFTLKK